MNVMSQSSVVIQRIYETLIIKHYQLVCFTSTMRRAGVTTIACLTAEVAASFQQKVLYCDFGCAEKSLSKQLKLSSTNKKSTTQHNWQDFIVAAKDFDLIPIPTEVNANILKDDALAELFTQLKQNYDLIIIDSADFNDYSGQGISPRQLSKLADAVLLVVLSARDTESTVMETINNIHYAEGNLLGCFMNDIDCPRLVDEICRATLKLDKFAPAFAEKIRSKLRSMKLFKIEI